MAGAAEVADFLLGALLELLNRIPGCSKHEIILA